MIIKYVNFVKVVKAVAGKEKGYRVNSFEFSRKKESTEKELKTTCGVYATSVFNGLRSFCLCSTVTTHAAQVYSQVFEALCKRVLVCTYVSNSQRQSKIIDITKLLVFEPMRRTATMKINTLNAFVQRCNGTRKANKRE